MSDLEINFFNEYLGLIGEAAAIKSKTSVSLSYMQIDSKYKYIVIAQEEG